jgi:hypothetical protein
MHPIQQWAGQNLPAASSSQAAPTLAQLGYDADQGAEIGMAVSVVPIVGLVLGAIVLSALNPSDAIPRWIWAVLGGGVGLAAGNALGVAAVKQIKPSGIAASGVQPAASFDEVAFYQNLGQSLSSQIQSAMSSSAAPATTDAPTTIPASLQTTS